ncbi:hypothetical protein [Pseudosulfitobacter sp. DSM 107133]|uniref:hypothetical protein n=1 Tax=Pseudosulfitobacter sp. DSM 107133 TaxID=2883100 RepID=UPI000DF415C0|nr:hypothetical protein [Pseudosulfitobacter sp. DSM 107133]
MDKLMNGFILLSEPLSDTQVSQYFNVVLNDMLRKKDRQFRMARMSGRFRESDEFYARASTIALKSLIEDGIRDNLPPKRIDPAWTKDELETAIHAYRREAEAIRGADANERINTIHEAVNGLKVSGLEHRAQLREATLIAKYKAQQLIFSSERVSVPVLNIDQQQPEADPQPTPAPMVEQIAPKLTGPVFEFSTHTVLELNQAFEERREVATDANSDQYSADIPSVFWRMAQSEQLSQANCKQRQSDIRLFCFVTGITSVADIQQHHIAYWRDILNKIPTMFLRSKKDTYLSLDDILRRTKDLSSGQYGLAPGTIKRHIKSIDLLLKRARNEGHHLPAIDLDQLKPKKNGKRDHKKRAVFRLPELQRLFAHSLWSGSMATTNRHTPGENVYKDAKYWIPLILAYTGARRAEVAGLLTDDISKIDGISVITIQSNKFRGVKGEHKDATEDEKLSRVIPIHRHLIDLGILEYANAKKREGSSLLFPDVVPKPRGRVMDFDPDAAGLNVKKFGQSIDHGWSKSVKLSLDGNPRKLCMHSLRHYVNNFMIHNTDIHEVTRLDLLGHVEGGGDDNKRASSINTTTYRDDTPIKIKKKAIDKLPRIF